MADESKWETIDGITARLPVPGGWIYSVRDDAGGDGGLVFVPDPGDSDLIRRYADELRAASLTLAHLRKRYRADACGCAPGACPVADHGLDAHSTNPGPGWVQDADGSWRRP